jgi:hypothetical protein
VDVKEGYVAIIQQAAMIIRHSIAMVAIGKSRPCEKVNVQDVQMDAGDSVVPATLGLLHPKTSLSM